METKFFENKESLEIIAATIAHEVKNPLALIQVNVDFLKIEDYNEKHDKHYETIKKEIKKVNNLILDFLKFVKYTYSFSEDVVVYDIISEIIEEYSIYEDRIKFILHNVDKNVYFLGNRQLFTWVLSNLIKNSVEAIEGKGFIEIETKMVSETVVIQIKDSGAGLLPDVLEKINNGEICTTKPNGSGIGLEICRKIVKELGGNFFVENSEICGCLATITVPKR